VALILDTGPLVAAADPTDPACGPCAALLEGTREPLVIPAPILAEVEYLSRRAGVPDAFADILGHATRGAMRIVDLTTADYVRVGELLKTYADLRVGFVDAAVLAVVERLREPKLATLDQRHFGVMRPRHVDALTLLPDVSAR
jgi:uncharacterized protein